MRKLKTSFGRQGAQHWSIKWIRCDSMVSNQEIIDFPAWFATRSSGCLLRGLRDFTVFVVIDSFVSPVLFDYFHQAWKIKIVLAG